MMERMTEYELGWWDATAATMGGSFGPAVRRMIAEIRATQASEIIPHAEIHLNTVLDAKTGTRLIIAGPITKRAVEVLRLYPSILEDVAEPESPPALPSAISTPEPVATGTVRVTIDSPEEAARLVPGGTCDTNEPAPSSADAGGDAAKGRS